MFKKPIYQCDLVDDIFGFTDFGLVNGAGYNLGAETGIKHIFVDNTVQNGRTYYYAVVAYDFGAPEIGPGIAPSENNAVIELDEAEEVRTVGKNVAVVVPHQRAAGYVPPDIEIQESDLLGSGSVQPIIRAQGSLKQSHQYALTFSVDTIGNINSYDYGFRYVTNGIKIYDETDSTVLIYSEDPSRYVGKNIVYKDTVGYWTLNTSEAFLTDIFDGLQVEIDAGVEKPAISYERSGWINGSGNMRVTPTETEALMLPWKYNIVFTDDDSAYVGIARSGTVRDENGLSIGTKKITEPALNFYVQNTSFIDTATGQYPLMDIVIQDVNNNDTLEIGIDRFFVGATVGTRWRATAFIIDFQLDLGASYPQAGNTYQVDWERPFFLTDTIRFSVGAETGLDLSIVESDLDSIRVVPNPYVMTNMMESAVSNPFLNQRRRIMFTHVPADCIIKIFTVSGVLVDEIVVSNEPDNGIIHWDMLTRENLEIAAGMYIYHIDAQQIGEEKVGKFAVIK